MANIHQITSSIWSWSVFSQERNLNFNGFYIEGEPAIIIDPPSPKNSIVEFIENLSGPKNIYLTNKHHTRASEVIRRKFGSKVWIHENDKKLMEIPLDKTFKDGENLEGGLQVVRIPNGKTEGESALFFQKDRAMIIGDAVIGEPEGELRMLPDKKFQDPAKAREGLRVLLDYDFDALLLGDGCSILENGKKKLQTFLG